MFISNLYRVASFQHHDNSATNSDTNTHGIVAWEGAEIIGRVFYKTLRRNSNMILTDVVAGEHSKYL